MRFKTNSLVLPLILVNVIIFVLQVFLGPGFTELFLLNSADVLQRPWILLTSMFLHGSPTHLLFNMYSLFLFGSLVEGRIGWKRFGTIYFASGILASLASSFFYARALGASGAVMGIVGVTIMLLPDLQLLLFGFVPMKLRTAGIVFAALDIFGIFVPNGIANIAHLAGLAIGLGYGYMLLSQKKKFHKKFTATSSSVDMSKEDLEEYMRSGRL